MLSRSEVNFDTTNEKENSIKLSYRK